MLNERLQKMRNKLWDSRPCITSERLVLQTEAYKKFAGEAVPIFRAKVVNYIMEHMTTLIMEDELVVGTPTNKFLGANLHPEFQSSTKFYLEELDEFPVRTKDPYDVSPEDREKILECLPYWEGKAMQDIAKSALPKHTVECMEDDIITVGLTNGVSGETTCDHEKLLTVGLKGYMEECQRNIDALYPKCQLDEEKKNFWQACIIQCQGLITYAHRMADEAERQAAECTDEKRKKELLMIAENCRVVPENP
ncbi:MAG: pyruvate formate-lyase, partial [Firmicutes bacterium]|nr:pyruvate formate-lyase [Bacillota bacterium]